MNLSTMDANSFACTKGHYCKKRKIRSVYHAFIIDPHLHQLHEILKELLLINGEFAVVIDDAVVLHLAVAADTQGVISRIVGALPDQEQARLRRVEETLCLFAGYLPMKPAGKIEESGGQRF